MHCGNGSSIRKANSDSVDMIHVQLTRTEKVAVHEKYHVRMNHYEDHKIVPVLHQEYWLYPER